MGVSDHVTYYNAITQLEAQEVLLGMSIVDFPNMNKEERKKRHKSLHKKAFPSTHENKMPLSVDNFAGFLNVNSKKVDSGG